MFFLNYSLIGGWQKSRVMRGNVNTLIKVETIAWLPIHQSGNMII